MNPYDEIYNCLDSMDNCINGEVRAETYEGMMFWYAGRQFWLSHALFLFHCMISQSTEGAKNRWHYRKDYDRVDFIPLDSPVLGRVNWLVRYNYRQSKSDGNGGRVNASYVEDRFVSSL